MGRDVLQLLRLDGHGVRRRLGCAIRRHVRLAHAYHMEGADLAIQAAVEEYEAFYQAYRPKAEWR